MSGYIYLLKPVSYTHLHMRTPYSELDKAILDVKEGNVKNFDTLEDMMNYLEA